jgi:hypothetical protein
MDAVTTMNPFALSERPEATRLDTGNAIARTDQSRAIAEVQAAMAIARMNPRDPVAAMDRILNACARPTLADAAVYTYSRGGSDVTGPSIRLAEAIAQSWGNLQFGIRELEQGGGVSTVQAYAWDIEANTRREVTFQVPHVRHTKAGQRRLEDPRDIYEMVANQGARRLRACILAVIPGDVVEAAVSQCEVTMSVKADTSAEAMQKMLTAFGEYGVTREQIEARIQRRLDAIQPAQVVALKKVYASMRDGMSGPGDWFEQPEVNEPQGGGTKAERVAAKADAAAGKKKTTQPDPAVDSPMDTINRALERAAKVADIDTRALAIDDVRHLIDALPAVQRDEIYERVRVLMQNGQGVGE